MAETKTALSAHSDADSTSLSLLGAAKGRRTSPAWQTLLEIYTPRIYEACRRAGVRPADLLDLCNEVWLAVVRKLGTFEKTGEHKGEFRAWLTQITKNKICDYYRKHPRLASLVPGDRLDQLAWSAESDTPAGNSSAAQRRSAAVLRKIEERYGREAMRIFVRLVVEGGSGAEVAAEFNKTRNAVYTCKSRILSWLRAHSFDPDFLPTPAATEDSGSELSSSGTE